LLDIERILSEGPGETYDIDGGAELPNLAVIGKICRTADAAFANKPSLNQRFTNAPPPHGRP